MAFSILKENVFPRATEHLDYAQRQWKHPEVRTRFQARNRFEQQLIFDDVALRDSYGIEKMSFAPDDVVVDIGAHVGIFSYMCYRRGSRSIHAYEAEIENFERLARFVGDVAGIFPYHLAVFRSDQNTVDSLSHSGYPGDNTGGGTVLFRGQTADFDLQAILDEPTGAQSTCVIALDEILKQFTRVRLLKLDCEGSEFPILLTSQLLERVEQILGEYHEIEPALYARLDPAAQFENYSAYRVEHLVARLEQCGFQVCVRAHSPAHWFLYGDTHEECQMKHKPGMLFLQVGINPPGGRQSVAAWALEALKDDYAISFVTWKPPCWEEINRFYGTRLHPSQFRVVHMPVWLRRLAALDPDPYSIQPSAILMRVGRWMARNHELIISL